jgi:hypothetical protein
MNNKSQNIKTIRSEYVNTPIKVYFENYGLKSFKMYLCVEDIKKAYNIKERDFFNENMSYLMVELEDGKTQRFIDFDHFAEIKNSSKVPYNNALSQEICEFIAIKVKRLTGVTPSDLFTYEDKKRFCMEFEQLTVEIEEFMLKIAELEPFEELVRIWTNCKTTRLYSIDRVVKMIGRPSYHQARILNMLREHGDLDDEFNAKPEMIENNYAQNNINEHIRVRDRVRTKVTLFTLPGINYIQRLIAKTEAEHKEQIKKYKERGLANG